MYTTIVIFVCFLTFLLGSYRAWRAILLERATHHRSWKREAGVNGFFGSLSGFLATYLVYTSHFSLGAIQNIPIVLVLLLLSSMTFGVTVLVWLSRTKLSFWIIYGWWPTEEEWWRYVDPHDD